MKKQIVVTFKAGNQCEHNPVIQDAKEWSKWVDKITAEIMTLKSDFLILNSPYGLHRVEEIAEIHFGDLESPILSPSSGHSTHGIAAT